MAFKCPDKEKKCELMNVDPKLLSDMSAEVLWNSVLKRRPNLKIALKYNNNAPKKKAKKS